MSSRQAPPAKLVLVADHHDDSARLLADLIECAAPYEAVSAKDGREALKMALARRPDACVLDIDLPHIGGLEAAHRLRFMFGNRRPLLIAATEGQGAPAAQRSGLFDHVMTKPVQVTALLRLLETM